MRGSQLHPESYLLYSQISSSQNIRSPICWTHSFFYVSSMFSSTSSSQGTFMSYRPISALTNMSNTRHWGQWRNTQRTRGKCNLLPAERERIKSQETRNQCLIQCCRVRRWCTHDGSVEHWRGGSPLRRARLYATLDQGRPSSRKSNVDRTTRFDGGHVGSDVSTWVCGPNVGTQGR
jgi:hypothetical protein